MHTNLARSLLLLAVVGLAAEAQQAETAAAAVAAARAAEIEALEPGLSSEELSATDTSTRTSVSSQPTALLAQDVRRRAVSNGVMDEIDLDRIEITGNQELPKVLYIVPWKKSDPGDLTGKPVNTLLDEVLAPIDRSEFIRRIEYYGDLYSDEEG